jgi:hypothetical protein
MNYGVHIVYKETGRAKGCVSILPHIFALPGELTSLLVCYEPQLGSGPLLKE